MQMSNKDMTADDIRDFIAKSAKEKWEQLLALVASPDYDVDSEVTLLYRERWYAVHDLCCKLNIDYLTTDEGA